MKWLGTRGGFLKSRQAWIRGKVQCLSGSVCQGMVKLSLLCRVPGWCQPWAAARVRSWAHWSWLKCSAAKTHCRDVPRLVLVVCVHCHPGPAENLFLMLQLVVVQLCIPDSPITLLMFLGIAVCIVNNVLKVCVHACQQTWRLMF